MNRPSRSVRTILRNQSFRIPMLMAAAAITFAGWRWVSLERYSIYMGAISPSGKKFISYTFHETSETWKVAAHVRDVETGMVLHDLSRFPLAWGSSSIAWADEATLVANVMNGDSSNLMRASRSSANFNGMLTIQLDEELTVLDQKEFVDQRKSSVRVTGDGDITFAVVEYNIQPRYVEIRKTPLVDGEGDNETRLLSRLEFGNDEQAYCFRAADSDRDILIVEVSPTLGATPKGDFVFTDGVSQTTLVVNLKTGEVLHEVRGGYEPIPHSLDFLAKQAATGIDICRIDNVNEVVAKVPPKNGGKLYVVAFGDRWKVIREETPSDMVLHVIDGHRDAMRDFRFAERANASLAGADLLVASEGKLERIDLEESDHRKQLVNVRPFVRVFAAISMVGIPLFVFCVLVGLVRASSRTTFFDVAFTCTFVAGSFMVLGQAADVGRGNGIFFLSMAFGFLGAALAVLLVWVSTSKAMYGLGIPLFTIALAAAILLFKIVWPDSGVAAMAFVGFSLLIFFQSVGHVLFRRFVGRIVAGDIDDSAQTQFSVRQVGVFTAAVAVLLACLRLVTFGDNRPPITMIFWIVLFAGAYSTCVLLAQWCAFRLTNRLASFILCLVGTIATLGCLHLLNRSMWLNPNIGGAYALQIYTQPVIAAMVVWTTLQITRRSGYRLHRKVSGAAEGNVAY